MWIPDGAERGENETNSSLSSQHVERLCLSFFVSPRTVAAHMQALVLTRHTEAAEGKHEAPSSYICTLMSVSYAVRSLTFTFHVKEKYGAIVQYNAIKCTSHLQHFSHVAMCLCVCFCGRNGDAEMKNSLLPKEMGTLIMSGSKQVRQQPKISKICFTSQNYDVCSSLCFGASL